MVNENIYLTGAANIQF